VTKSEEKNKVQKFGFSQFLKILSSDFHQICRVVGAPQGGSLCKILPNVYFPIIFINLGSKKFFSGGPTAKPEVELVAEVGEGRGIRW